jgi:hypothetical protein
VERGVLFWGRQNSRNGGYIEEPMLEAFQRRFPGCTPSQAGLICNAGNIQDFLPRLPASISDRDLDAAIAWWKDQAGEQFRLQDFQQRPGK